MPIDASTLPVSPIFVIAVVGYGAVAALITGPEIAAREISRSNWRVICQSELVTALETTRRPDRVIPQVPDVGGLLCSVYPELSDLCAMIPDPNAATRATEQRLRAAEDKRLRQAASGTTSACSCAEAVYVENERLSLALYAGTGRIVIPASVKNRASALTRALHSPACQREG